MSKSTGTTSVALLDTTRPRLDRDKGILRRVHVLGNQSAWGYSYGTDAQRAVVSRFEGMTCGIDHADPKGPKLVKETFGTFHNPVVDEQGTWADLHYLTNHERAPAILEDIERGIGLFSLSIVASGVKQVDGVVTAFTPVAVDIVVGGATTGTLFEQYDRNVDRIRAARARTIEIGKRASLFEQYVNPAASLEQTIAKVTSGVDLAQFHND